MDIEKYDAVDFGSTEDLKDFLHVDITWSRAVAWSDFNPGKEQFIYAIINDHKNRKNGPEIQYIGITEDGRTRFKKGDYEEKLSIGSYTKISTGVISSSRMRKLKNKRRDALEEIEHIFIWALCDRNYLHNYDKQSTLPGWGRNGTEAYHIINHGFRFWNRMPREIIYPWALVKR